MIKRYNVKALCKIFNKLNKILNKLPLSTKLVIKEQNPHQDHDVI